MSGKSQTIGDFFTVGKKGKPPSSGIFPTYENQALTNKKVRGDEMT